MTNQEFYGNKLLAIALSYNCKVLYKLTHDGEVCYGSGCDSCCFQDNESVENWLSEEYETPLLKNGDNLKAGDWIMVREGEGGEWRKRQFLFFYDGLFFAAPKDTVISENGEYVDWRQARMPDKGE